MQSQRLGPKNSPSAQELHLGCVVIGDVCLGKSHKPAAVSVLKTNVISYERRSVAQPCKNKFHLTEDLVPYQDSGDDYIFQRLANDDQFGLSLEDRQFFKIMDDGLVKDEDGRWKAPLPFKPPRPRLKNNRLQALKHSQTLDSDLKRNPIKKQHMLTFMESIMESGDSKEEVLVFTSIWGLSSQKTG